MVLVRKRWAGSDSYGHVWAADGDIVEMPYEQARELLAISDAGFEIVEPERTEVDEAPTPARRGRRPRADTAVEE